MKALHETTVEYAKTREQFGAAIGSFQAIQHRLVDMMIAYEEAISVTYMATLRLDGFVALVARGERVGRLLTKPFVLGGDKIYINAASEEDGSIKVVLLDEAGKPVPGFKSRSIRGDGVKLPVTWRAGADLKQWRGKTVRLQFVMSQADLYSFGCEDSDR